MMEIVNVITICEALCFGQCNIPICLIPRYVTRYYMIPRYITRYYMYQIVLSSMFQ